MDCVLERNGSVNDQLAPPGATPTVDALPRRLADFGTIGEALDYAAKGTRGLNFHDPRGDLSRRGIRRRHLCGDLLRRRLIDDSRC